MLIAIVGGCIYLNRMMPIITGYAAKNLASAVFVSGREAKNVEAIDLNFSLIRFTNNTVDYTRTPAVDSGNRYGAFFWLNKNGKLPDVPRDMFYCDGHDGQDIFLFPTQELVVVVLGFSPKPDNVIDFNALLRDVLKVKS